MYSYDDALSLVEFMYRGEINVAQERIHSLLKTAENLRVKGLAEVSTDSPSAAEKPNPTPNSNGGGAKTTPSNNNQLAVKSNKVLLANPHQVNVKEATEKLLTI